MLAVVGAILVLWYAACVPMNAAWTRDQAARAGGAASFGEVLGASWGQQRPVLPAPHQVAGELWRTVALVRPGSKRSLVYHAWVTLSATMLGFAIGAALGIGLAAAIVHDRATDLSVMPWAVASQTVPILAVAPMVIVVMNAVGVQGLLPKAMISAYLTFFPVVVGMAQGFRSPQPMDLDLMATWGASRGRVFCHLRLPASLPYLFASLRIAAAASLVGTIVGELPTGAVAGLGARLLSGSYYGQTVQIWAALVAAAVVAAGLVGAVALAERAVLARMGMPR